MDHLNILGIAVGLAMDAFSVSLAAGFIIEKPGLRHYFRLAFHFGLFQFFMPVIGYAAGKYVESWIRDYDHWVALTLLALIGGKMIRDSLSSDEEHRFSRDPSRGLTLIALAVATSIDALAVGLVIGVHGKPILYPSIVIGVVCAFFSVAGVFLGKRAGILLGKRVEMFGGILLIAIGLRIVYEHLCV